MSPTRIALLIVFVLLTFGTLRSDHVVYEALETALPAAIFSLILVVALERLALGGTARSRGRGAAVVGVVASAFITPWLISAFAVWSAGTIYRRMAVRPYASWDVVLTYTYFFNIVVMYCAAALILLAYIFQVVRRESAAANSASSTEL